MAETYDTFAAGLDMPATSAFPITPYDAELPLPTRALYVGGSGDVTGVLVDDGLPVTFNNLPAGAVLPVRFRRIVSATATGLVGLL